MQKKRLSSPYVARGLLSVWRAHARAVPPRARHLSFLPPTRFTLLALLPRLRLDVGACGSPHYVPLLSGSRTTLRQCRGLLRTHAVVPLIHNKGEEFVRCASLFSSYFCTTYRDIGYVLPRGLNIPPHSCSTPFPLTPDSNVCRTIWFSRIPAQPYASIYLSLCLPLPFSLSPCFTENFSYM